MSDTPHATVSLKGAGKEALWIVLNGTAEEMVQQVQAIFNFPPEQTEGLDPVELFVNADSTLKALTTAGTVLGAKVLPKDETGGWHGEAEKEQAQDPHGDAWERAGATQEEGQAQSDPEPESAPENGSDEPEAEHPYAALIDQLLAAESIDGLKEIWSKNREAFKNEDVTAAYKKRGAELKSK